MKKGKITRKRKKTDKKRDIVFVFKNWFLFLLIVLLVVFVIFLVFILFFKEAEKPTDGLPSVGIGKQGEFFGLGWDDCGFLDNLFNPESVVPRPQNISLMSCNIVNISSSWSIYADLSGKDNFSANFLKNKTYEKSSGLVNLNVKNISDYGLENKIVIGNPNTNSIIKDLAFLNNINLNSEINKGFNQGYIILIKPNEIIVFSNSSAGGFYGVITLLWLMKQNGNIISLPNVKIKDWPDFKIRGFYGAGSYYKTKEEWIENLTMLKYNLWTHSIDSLSPNPSQYYINITLNREKFLKDRHFFTSVSLHPYNALYYNYNFYEGAFAENVSLKFNSSEQAEPVEQDFAINNSDFEIDSDGDGIPDYWFQSNNNSENYWKLDCTTSVSGSCSAKLNLSYDLNGTNSSAGLITGNNSKIKYYPIKLNRIYQFSVWAKKNTTTPFKSQTQVTFVLTNETKTPIATSSVGFEGYEAGGFGPNLNIWEKYTNSFSTYNNESYIYIYSRSQSTDALELWIDNITLSEVNNKLVNIIETNDTTIHIWNENRTIEHARDVDYSVILGSLDRDNPLNGTRAIITRINSGRISPGEKVSVDYDFLPKMQQWRYEYNSLSDPGFLKVYKEKMVEPTLSVIKPDFVFIGQDEMRGINRDSRAKKRGLKNYQVFAYFENNVSNIIHSYSPESNVLIWDDIFSPFHTGQNPDAQASFGGQKGKTWYAMDIMNRSFIPIIWWYSTKDYWNKMTNSPILYNKYGFRFLGGPWSDDINIRWWSYLSYKNNALGIMEHEFYDNVTGVPIAANYSWNAIKVYSEGCNPDYAEICDGMDNDCDGLYWINSYTQKQWPSNIDENFNLSSDAFNCGICGNICYYSRGYSSCVNGACQFDRCYEGYFNADSDLSNGCECSLTNNGIETCDGIDNDCNGQVDEVGGCSSNDGNIDGNGGPSGPSSPSIVNKTNKTCKENWSCGNYAECINGKQKRECYDLNKCGTNKNAPEFEKDCPLKVIRFEETPKILGFGELILYAIIGILILLILIIFVLFFRNKKKREKRIFEEKENTFMVKEFNPAVKGFKEDIPEAKEFKEGGNEGFFE